MFDHQNGRHACTPTEAVSEQPLPSELGTHKPAKARFWSWLGPFWVRRSCKQFQLFLPRSPTEQHRGYPESLSSSVLLVASLESSDSKSLRAFNTSPPRNRRTKSLQKLSNHPHQGTRRNVRTRRFVSCYQMSVRFPAKQMPRSLPGVCHVPCCVLMSLAWCFSSPRLGFHPVKTALQD